MHLFDFSAFVLAVTSLTQWVDASRPQNLLEDLQARAVEALKSRKPSVALGNNSCSIDNAAIRRDWNDLATEDRKAYIKAVQCMYSSPSKSDPAKVPGARTRYDDFVAQHINQTTTIHGTGNFLSWHRYFVYGYEKALREECGYQGYQPYWNWFTYQDNLKNSPVFDGSDTSMGGDGFFVKHNGSVGGGGRIFLPSGGGGGCIASGPFKDLAVNLGPVSPTMAGETKVPERLAYNPRCTKRDLTNFSSRTWLTFDNLYNITLGVASTDVEKFQNELQGRFTDGFLGMHAAGHYAIGGDAGDFYSSPNDPVFFLHHSMLDRVWWIWQALHPQQANSVAGSRVFTSPEPKTTLEDVIEVNYLDLESVKIKEMLDTLGGEPLCYTYL